MDAALKNDAAAMRAAVARGADVNMKIQNAPGTPTLLCGAIPDFSRETVKFLIDSGADVNAIDEKGSSPLIQLSCYSTRRDGALVAGDLIKAGADIHAKNYRDMTAVDYAIHFLKSAWDLKKSDPDSDYSDKLATQQDLVDRLTTAGARSRRNDSKEMLREIDRMARSIGRT